MLSTAIQRIPTNDQQQTGDLMSNHVYKKIEIVGASSKSIEDAVEKALERASKTVHNMRWFEISETRGDIENGKVAHWQVTVKIGFTLDD
jgi:flavin-binding protein dodecin